MSDAEPTDARETRSLEGDAQPLRPCILSGEVRSTGTLCDVISFLAHASWWGELIVDGGGVMRSLYFDEGHVVAATSTATTERIGDVLVKIGALTAAQADECGELARERNLRFGEAVVERGLLTREKLFGLLGKQIGEIFCGIAAMETGSFAFLEGFDDGDLSYRLRCSVDGLLLDAIRRMDEQRHLEAPLAPADDAPARAAAVAPAADDPFDPSSPRAGVQKTVDAYNAAMTVLLRELDALDRGDEVRAQLTKFVTTNEGDASFAEVKPGADGTLNAGELSALVDRSTDSKGAEERLGKWLYDYGSYALFLARPHLARRDGERISVNARVSRRVAELLDPIAPGEGSPLASDVRASEPIASEPIASEAPAPSRKTALLPGIDPSRTARMPRVVLPSRAGGPPRPNARATTRLAAFVPPALPRRAPVVSPVVSPVASPVVPAVIAAAPRGATAPRSSRIALAALVVASALAAGVLVGTRAKMTEPLPATTKASTPNAKTELVVACDPSCGTIFIDGKVVASTFEPIAVTPGPHDVVVFEKGFAQQLKRIEATEGRSQAVAFRLATPPR